MNTNLLQRLRSLSLRARIDSLRQPWQRRIALLLASAGLALGCAAATGFEPWPEGESGASISATDEAEPSPAAADNSWTELRHGAAMGSATAALQLVDELILDYEISGGDEKLYEAVIWIDRYHGTDEIAHSLGAWRVASNHCNHKVLRFHWLCQNGE